MTDHDRATVARFQHLQSLLPRVEETRAAWRQQKETYASVLQRHHTEERAQAEAVQAAKNLLGDALGADGEMEHIIRRSPHLFTDGAVRPAILQELIDTPA